MDSTVIFQDTVWHSAMDELPSVVICISSQVLQMKDGTLLFADVTAGSCGIATCNEVEEILSELLSCRGLCCAGSSVAFKSQEA